MSNYNLTCLAIFGVLLIVTVAAASSLLLPATKIVSATTTTSGANETAAATATGSSNLLLTCSALLQTKTFKGVTILAYLLLKNFHWVPKACQIWFTNPWANFRVGSKDLVSSQKEGSHIAAESMMIHPKLTILF